MVDCRSLRDCLLENVDDIDFIIKQILESLLNRDKHRRGSESLNSLVTLFEGRINEVKSLLERVGEFRAREDLIRQLEICVRERNEIIDKLETNLKVAEMALTSAIYQANNKIHSVRESEAHPVNSEVVIRFAHQISKNYSVVTSLILFCIISGDPSRPFPTEPEFRASALAAPRTNPPVVPSTFNLLRQQHAVMIMVEQDTFPTARKMAERSISAHRAILDHIPVQLGGMGRVSSPMTGMPQIPIQGKVWSPRTGYQQASPSPRGRGGAQWTSRGGGPGGISPFQKRNNTIGESSPRMVSPTVNINFVSPLPRINPPPVNKVPLQIGDYNDAVDKNFKLPYENDVTGVLVLSTPDMFDISFQGWVLMKYEEFGSFEALSENVSSPIEEFLRSRMTPLCEKLNELGIEYELVYDHSLSPNRKPRILMQTCGHVAGAAYYYQPSHVSSEDWSPLSSGNKKLMGLSLHPVYGGHFAFRSAFIFPQIHLVDFYAPKPLSILHSQAEIRDALESFNYNWKESHFRDFGAPIKRYSATQMEYFGKPVADRWSVLKKWCME
ncbi:hypothetical protein DICVIV_04684 [Dictyocaulus viviparus]|uniref:Mediator of RNA polymerase II transcription subunit 4 n=1 Tax=Dictyocaulus viviparus TaxID=29172 RepID=A0A0D8XX24_DICVI|nr:hypothetical protein DICVIV_04684 [Dictyocaulus viviparus]